jgi:hypothetical protein
MSYTIYKQTLKPTKGLIYYLFKQGLLKQLYVECGPGEGKEALSFIHMNVPFVEESVRDNKECVELKPRTVQDKVVAFCMAFRNYRNTAYTPKKNERANLADVTVSKEMLDVYFSTTDFPLSYSKSINDYVKHYNHIRDVSTNGKPLKNRLPDVYDREYERKLEGPALSTYWQHLIKLGWKKVDGNWRRPIENTKL